MQDSGILFERMNERLGNSVACSQFISAFMIKSLEALVFEDQGFINQILHTYIHMCGTHWPGF